VETIVETDGRIKLTSPLELKRGCTERPSAQRAIA